MKKVFDVVFFGYLVDVVWFIVYGIVYEIFCDYVKCGWFECLICGVFCCLLLGVFVLDMIDWKICLFLV